VATFELHEFQERAFLSEKRIVAMAAGIQSGKTLTGALWAGEKAAELPPGYNGIICAPTYKILAQATLPAFLATYGKYGKFQKIESKFTFHHGVTVYIRSLTDPNALEGITKVGFVWLDEGGLISKYAWDNVLGRAAFMQAQVMITTTPYSLNWLFLLWQDWKDGKRDDVEFVQFTSRQNPHFPEEEYLRQKRLLDTRRFNMKFMGQFGRMEGLVYENVAYVHSFPMPEGTVYYAGVDWGYTNPFVLTIRAITPEGLHYRVAEYYKSGLMIEEIAQICKARKQLYNIKAFVCDPSAPAYIEGLNRAGCPAIKGNNDVRKGIDTHASIIKQNRFFIFEAENPQGKDEYSTYHYPEPRDYKIDEDQKEQEPVKASDHGCDADRYVTMHLESMAPKKLHEVHSPTIPTDQLKRLEWLKKGGSSRFNR
jgi:PBSX family phage terminase large subunit